MGVFLYALNQCGLSLWGWSERAATNAPVQDELIEAVLHMNKKPILLARTNFFFPPLFSPKISPPPTYHLPPHSHLPPTNPSLPPPSPKLQRCRAGVSLELGLLEQELGPTKAWSCWRRGAVAGAGAGLTRDPGKHLSSFLFLWTCTATHYKQKRTLLSSLASSSSFARLQCCWSSTEAQRSKEGDNSNCRCLLPLILWRCNTARVALQRNKATLLE